MTLAALIDGWLRERSRQGVKASSLRIYRMRLRPIVLELGAVAPTGLTRWQWREALYLATQKADGSRLAADTIGLTYSLVRALQTWALDEEIIDTPWLKPSDLKRPAGHNRERMATAEETARLLGAMSPAFARYYQALRLTGARRAELCSAGIGHLQGTPGARTIVLKEHKTSRTQGPRVIYLGLEADQLVTQAIGQRRSGPIFVDEQGRAWLLGRVTRIFRRHCRQLGISDDLKLHSTRHEFATRMVRRHGIKAAQIACGHSDLKTTEKYAHLGDDYLRSCVSGLYADESGDPAGAAA